MTKRTIASLTAKGYSQKKIALTLKIRKSKVVSAQKKLKIGRRRVVSPFWRDVESYKRMFGVKHKTAIVQVKHSPYWGGKRLKKMSPGTMEYWKQKYEIERRMTGERVKIWREEERVAGETPK